MIKLSNLLNEFMTNPATGKPPEATGTDGSFYDWTRDFDVFKNNINSTTETAKKRFEKALSAKVLNKQVMVRASKGYKQPVKDYTIKRVTGVNINDFYDDWVVVLKNEFNKEFFLTAGYKVKVLGVPVASEPGAAQTPQQPEQPPQQTASPPQQKPTQPSVQPQRPQVAAKQPALGR